MKDQHGALATMEPGARGNLSLIERGDTLDLWHWHSYALRRGRRVRLDRFFRTIFPIEMHGPVTHVPDARIIHPDLGIAVQKVKGKDREPLPTDILCLRNMWFVARSAGSDGSEPLDETCCACGLKGLEGDKVSTCPMCLTSWHTNCQDRVATYPSMHELMAVHLGAIDRDVVPASFKDALRLPCRAHC